MARKTIRYTVTDEGRDKGKVFVLTELSASEAEDWAASAFLALSRSGADIPDDVQEMGMSGLAVLGLRALSGLKIEEARPLLARMFACVQINPDPARPEIVRALIEDDIEEVKTRLLLRKEVFDLHTGFFTSAARTLSEQAATAQNTSATQMFPIQ